MGLLKTGGSFPAGLTPSPTKTLFSGNYLTFDSGSGGGTFAQQFLPDVYEKEVERYGNRSVSSFLRMVGAEIPSASDQVIWSEQGRLHIAYDSAAAHTTTGVITENGHAVRAGQTVAIAEGLVTIKGVVSAVTTNTFTVLAYGGSTLDAAGLSTGTAVAVKVFVYGSEFAKGTAGMTGSIDAGFQQFSNSPIIIKDKYSISGSDAAQIGWVEVTTENGASGYLWYLKSEHETRLRFEDYLEMSMVEGEKAAAGSGAIGASYKGTEGLFAAIESRGNIYQNFNSGEATLANSGADRTALGDFDEILKNLDKQGAIEENMLFLNRATALAFDDMLGAVNAHYNGGSSFGVFNNSEDMALNLGFSGFRRGSYDFYKTDWKYLNDAATRGLTEDIDGVLVPAGTSTVYDQQLGKNIKRPFLHVRYRASEADDRKMKSWITGSVGGVYTSDVDEMNVHFLSERCLCVQGANNFTLFKSVTQS
mgnify:FL=1|tara:strand:- start:9519 stop:10949 length:1431 start_codon:yes stop_codon:yes gene_type:complete